MREGERSSGESDTQQTAPPENAKGCTNKKKKWEKGNGMYVLFFFCWVLGSVVVVGPDAPVVGLNLVVLTWTLVSHGQHVPAEMNLTWQGGRYSFEIRDHSSMKSVRGVFERA